MTIIEERFSRDAALGKEAWRLRCPKCQRSSQICTEDSRCHINGRLKEAWRAED